MNAIESEAAITELASQPFERETFPYAFLPAFGNKETTLKRLRSGPTNGFDGTLYVALSPAPGAFEIHAWDGDGLRPLFRHDLPGRPALFCLGADEDAMHAAYEDGGLARMSLDWAGRIAFRRRQPRRGGPMWAIT